MGSRNKRENLCSVVNIHNQNTRRFQRSGKIPSKRKDPEGNDMHNQVRV